jgi:transposase
MCAAGASAKRAVFQGRAKGGSEAARTQTGWSYRLFRHATLQTCLAHLLRRCDEMLETATRGGVRFPRKIKTILKDALELRDRRDARQISPHGLRVAKGRLEARMGRALCARITNAANRRFAKHLTRYEHALFVFLDRPDLEATNWPAEHAIRPAVVNRKSCGGNRTQRSARTQAVLMSLLRTCHQQGHSVIRLLTKMLREPTPRPQRLLLPSYCGW